MITTIGIIDDHKIVRQGLKDLLGNLGNYKVVLEYENGISFLTDLPSLKKVPDLFILDYSMPSVNGIDVLKKMNESHPEYKVLLLTQHFDEQIINDAYTYGARGFLPKTCAAHDLKFAIDNIVKFGYNNVSEILKRIQNHKIQEPKKSFQITERELKFLELVCDERELTYDQMAEIMGVSVKSIDVYRSSLFEKYGIKSKTGLVLFSFKNKLTKPFL
jgi:DNA-binding NarL/FixJ family response regulator